jgi:hypothetical protein
VQLGGPATGPETSAGANAFTSACGEVFGFRGRRGSALVAPQDPPSDHGAYQNDKQRYSFCLSIGAKESSGMTTNRGTLSAATSASSDVPQR